MSKKFRAKKLISIALSVAMAAAITVVPSFASSSAEVLSDAVLIGSTPYAGAKAVAPGSSTAPQPIRLAFSEGAATVAADVNDYVAIKSGDTAVDVTATVEGNIVTLTPAAALSSNTTYTVDFDQEYLPKVEDFTFTTSKGGTGSGTGGGQAGSQALVLTGNIPAENATVDASQTMYLTFSTNIAAKSVLTNNYKAISVKTVDGADVTADISIIDNWTVEINLNNLESGKYVLEVLDTLQANSGNTLSKPVEINFNI